MTGSVDLHTHSTASDGRLSPTALVELAAEVGLASLALTDHDSVAGLDEASSAAEAVGVSFIPGIELSADLPGGECHILGYYLDDRAPALRQVLQRLQQSRQERGYGMVQRLRAMGVPLSWERVQALAQGGLVTRTHIAEALLEAGVIDSRQEAFDRYIGYHGPAYVVGQKLSPVEAVRLLRQVRGVPVLAHPTFVEPERDWRANPLFPWPFLEELCQAGLLGLEAYFGGYSTDLSARLLALAEHYGLIVTGGTDFHGHDETPPLGSVPVPPHVVGDLCRLAQRCQSPWMGELRTPVRP